MLTTKWFKLVVVGLLTLVFMLGCSKDDDNVTNPPMSEKANVRVIHSSVDAPAVDVWVDGSVAITALNYRETSGYVQLDAGQHNVKVTPTGASTPVVIDATVTLEANKDYSVVALGKLANITALITEDNRTPNSSKAKVRFLHASPDAPAVDIKIGSGTGPAVFANRAFNTITQYIEVDAGSYSFVVTAANDTSEVAVFNPIDLANGMVYTVVATGTLDPSDNIPFSVRAFVDNDNGTATADFVFATARVMVTHASPDAPGVDLLVDGMVVNSAPLTFPNSTDYLTVNAGTRNVKVNVSGSATTVINADLTLLANQSYSVFAANAVSMIEPLVFQDDLTMPAAGKAHVRFLHLSPDAPTVDITLSDGTTIFDDISFKQITDFLPLDAGTYNLQVRTADGVTVVLDLGGISLTDGKIYTVFAKGFLNGSGAQALGAQIIVNN